MFPAPAASLRESLSTAQQDEENSRSRAEACAEAEEKACAEAGTARQEAETRCFTDLF